MQLEEIKTLVSNLPAEDRRKLALYILELEKDHLQQKIGPQISEDLDSVSKAVQEGIDKIKKLVNKA